MNVILNAFLVTGATSGGKLWPFAIYRRFLPIKITQSSRHYEGRFNVDEETAVHLTRNSVPVQQIIIVLLNR